ncbi:MAG: polysaccharide biosynthesis protein, partial [Parvimonas sp.]|nr:polysaccharide biosynthesis protein [Parvimonas sp.]
MVRKIFLIILDIIVINLCYYLGFLLKFDWHIPANYWYMYSKWIIPIVLIKIIVFALFGLYRIMWRYADFKELSRIFMAIVVANVLTGIFLISMNVGFPRSVMALVFVIDMFFVTGTRYLSKARKNLVFSIPVEKLKRVLIVGAGDAGVLVLNELRKHKELGYKVVVFIDDDKNKIGTEILGIPVVGGKEKIISAISEFRIDEVILAMPSANREIQQDISDICSKLSMKIKIIPGMYELIDDQKLNIRDLRDVEIGDLLGRDEVKLDQEVLNDFLRNKTVLVTGGGGSIGSELCRQIAKFSPKRLIILDIYENNAYEIQMELVRHYKDLDLVVEIESIRDAVRMDIIFGKYKPDVVFHAAAHKHVPLMENSSTSAIKNNVFGTLNVLRACDKHGVSRFVLISTDKAVNPTSVMGTTKRICEMLVQTFNEKSKTEFVAVRFGNVLGSNGSVIPLFINQIKEGGPVTVTHEDIIRYFMTIPEACQLVLQAGAIAKGGEIFILDMGEPVKILDLAKNLIRLSGYEPYKDIDIKITGLRPGEKLYEEILLNMENSV